jgi:hAT family C-terminal dimerisation region
MASSVSSERAFSSAGITISKRRNRLKADIVEALQFLKCLIHRDLIFRADPSASLDNDLDEDEDILTYGDVPNTEQGWDELWLEDDDAITDG